MGKKKNKLEAQNPESFWGRGIEYIMPREMYEDITADVKGDKAQAALDCINNTFGLLGHVTTITIEGV